MNSPSRRLVSALLAGGLVLAVAAASALAPASASTQSNSNRWEARLTALEPSEPMEYFRLGEEIAEAATSSRERETARHLFALAGLLDRDRLGASAALALAELESDETARRRLRALASLLATELNRPLPSHVAPPSGRAQWQTAAAVMLSDAFAYLRQGEGSRAMANLRRGSTRDLLENVVGAALPFGDVATFEETLRQYRNQKPPINRKSRIAFLHIERALLQSSDRSWVDDLVLSRHRPLLEVDPERLEETFGVDPYKPVYRDGRWVGVGNGE